MARADWYAPNFHRGCTLCRVMRSDPTAEGLRVVAQLKHLEDLTLHHARVSDEDFRGLEGMTSLKRLDASSTGITNRSLKQIATYTSLRTLRLTGGRMSQTGISDGGLEQLKPLKQLERLTIYRSVSKKSC